LIDVGAETARNQPAEEPWRHVTGEASDVAELKCLKLPLLWSFLRDEFEPFHPLKHGQYSRFDFDVASEDRKSEVGKVGPAWQAVTLGFVLPNDS